MAVLLVMGMLAMTLALSYASLRGQATVAQLAENQGRGDQARLAAESGVYDALRTMSESSWSGIDTPLAGNVSDHSWYEVSFVTGDGPLPATDPDYDPNEFAYRVTITSTGYADDPGQPSIRAIHSVEAIVQLARRAILDEPTTWPRFTDFTVYQWGNRDTIVQEPVRIHGKTNLLGRLNLSQEYPLSQSSPNKPRNDYLSGLNGMRLDGRGDHRPFASPLSIALTRQYTSTLTLLSTNLGYSDANLLDALDTTEPPALHPGNVVSYQLYPGGKSYTPPILQSVYGTTLAGASSTSPLVLTPDPIDNPLGIYRSRNSLTIADNVHIQGTIISEGSTPDVVVRGTNVKFEGVPIRPREQYPAELYQLPVALVKGDLHFYGTSDAIVRGLAMVYDDFELRQGAAGAKFSLVGHLFANGLRLRGRSSWIMTATDWDQEYNDYITAIENDGDGGLLSFTVNLLLGILDDIRTSLGLGSNDNVYFPEWVQHTRGFTILPALTFAPDTTSGVLPHWHDWSQPVYQKDPLDAGLRWNLVRWVWVEGS